MLRRAFLIAASIALLAAPLMAEEAKTAPDDEVKNVTVENGVTFEKSELKNDFKLIADGLRTAMPKATFKKEGSTLRVGVPALKGVAKNDVLLKIEHRSDCPNNSQFYVEPVPQVAKHDKTIRAVLAEWTRHRHGSPGAKLDQIVVTAHNEKKNYDVRLHLQKVAFLR